MVGRLFRRVTQSPFARAVATLSSGQMIAAALPILAAPILGRLYTPGDYGAIGLYMAIGSVLGPLATLQFHQGILSETTEQRAEKLFTLSAGLALVMAGLALFPVVVLYVYLTSNGMMPEGRGWLLLLPTTIAAGGATAASAMLANRRKHYGFLARNQVLVVAVTVTMSIALGYAGWGTDGLFTAYFVGQALALAAHLSLLRTMIGHVPMLAGSQARALARRHRDFARYTLPAEFVGNLSQSLPVYALTAVGTPADIGNFSRARQLVAMPMALIGSSIAQVFRQRAAEDYRTTGSCADIYKRTFLTLAAIGLPATIIFMVFAPDIFRVVLGPNWIEAGVVAQILGPMLLMKLVCSPLSTVFYFTGHQHLDLALMLASGVAVSLGMLLATLLKATPYGVVFVFSATYALVYLVYVIVGWRLSRGGR